MVPTPVHDCAIQYFYFSFDQTFVVIMRDGSDAAKAFVRHIRINPARWECSHPDHPTKSWIVNDAGFIFAYLTGRLLSPTPPPPSPSVSPPSPSLPTVHVTIPDGDFSNLPSPQIEIC